MVAGTDVAKSSARLPVARGVLLVAVLVAALVGAANAAASTATAGFVGLRSALTIDIGAGATVTATRVGAKYHFDASDQFDVTASSSVDSLEFFATDFPILVIKGAGAATFSVDGRTTPFAVPVQLDVKDSADLVVRGRIDTQQIRATTVELDDATVNANEHVYTGTISLAGNATLMGSGVSMTGEMINVVPIDATMPTVTFAVTNVNPFDVSGTIGGTVGDGGPANEQRIHLVKTDVGSLPLSGANTFSGGIEVRKGGLQVQSATALGTGVATIDGGAMVVATGIAVTSPSSIDVAGLVDPIVGPPALVPALSGEPASALEVPVRLIGDAAIRGEVPGVGIAPFALNGPIDGSGSSLDIDGPVAIGGAVTGAVGLMLHGGTVSIAESVYATGTLQIDGALQLAAADLTVSAGTVRGSGAITCGLVDGCGDLTIAVAGTPGATDVLAGDLGGLEDGRAFGLRKTGVGLLRFTGHDRRTGGTLVAEGEFRTALGLGADGPSEVTVDAAATLAGEGAVGTLSGLRIFGTLNLDTTAPGTVATSSYVMAGGVLNVGIDADAHSLLTASSVTLASAPVLQVRAGAGLGDGATTTIVDVAGSDPLSVTGTFGGLSEGDTVKPASGSGSFRITYIGGDGNDIALTYTAPPAPIVPDNSANTQESTSAPPATSAAATPARVFRDPMRVADTLVQRGGVLNTRVIAPGPGTVRQVVTAISGGRAGKPYCRVALAVKRAGAFDVLCKPTRAAVRRSKGRKLSIMTTFTPKRGGTTTKVKQTLSLPGRR